MSVRKILIGVFSIATIAFASGNPAPAAAHHEFVSLECDLGQIEYVQDRITMECGEAGGSAYVICGEHSIIIVNIQCFTDPD